MNESNERSALGTVFDRTMRSLTNRADVTTTKATTVRHLTPVKEEAQTFIIQTLRAPAADAVGGDFIFVEYIGTEGSTRIVLPPGVADVIARQRDALTTKNRKRAAKERAAADKAAGIAPGFMRVKTA